KNNQPNIISQKQDTIETSVNQNETSQPNPVKDLQADENLVEIKVKNPLSDKAFSYLALYRDIRFLSTCHIGANSLMTANSVKKLKQNRLDKFEESAKQVNIQVSATHLNHYESHLDRCIQLIEKYQDSAMYLSQAEQKNASIYQYMSQQLLTAPTVTVKEQQLKQLRNLNQPWDEAWQQLFNAAKGIISPEALAIKDQLDELDINWRQQYQGVEFEFTEAERNAHYETKKALKAQLEQLTGTNPKVKIQAWEQVQKLTAEIKAFMLLQDADLFFEASALLNDDRQLRFFNGSSHGRNFKRESLERLEIPYIKVAGEVMQLTGQINRLNFLAIAPYANQLYLCTTGQDCAPGSTLMSHYCLKPEYPTACDKDLMAFFVDDYLSPNQLQDVLNLYEQLVFIYAP
ncbi:hypothetical protein MNBD_GAMMA02-308, partial [hydrothermal vent metagenome]